MYPRQRNGAGNGYRSQPMGMNGSRISPEGSMRGHRMYNNNEYRTYNRGGYGHPKQFHPPPPPLPPQRETDIFVEAGKLAAQYLVSKGVLPPNTLSGKWQDDSVKNIIGEIRAARQREAENAQMYMSGRVSAPDVESGKGKISDESELIGGRSFAKGVVRSESLKFYGSEWKRELAKSGSWAGRSRDDMNSSPETVSKDCTSGDQKSPLVQMSQGSDTAANVETEIGKNNLLEDVNAGESSFRNEVSDVVQEQVKESDDANMSDAVSKVGEAEINNDMETDNNEDKEGSVVSKNDADLVRHSNFENMVTKTSPSLTDEGVNSDNNDEGHFVKEVSEVHALDIGVVNLPDNTSSDKTQEMNFVMPDVTINARVEKEPDVAMTKHKLDDERMSAFGNSSVFMEKGVKRAIDDNNDDRDDMKRLREWVPPTNTQFSDFEKQEPVNSKTAYITLSDDQSVSQFSRDFNDSCEFMKEKQLFPASFKTCDLNLVGMSHEFHENRVKSAQALPTVAETRKQGAAIDVDLSMGNNNCNTNSKNGRAVVNNTHIEIIDLEDESAQEDNTATHRRGDMTFTDLDGFHNNVNNGNELTDMQDGYGLMISELLGNESPNSSVASGLNSMHNPMQLPSAEEILGDDDSIYMSLGEIPISLLPWEQPSQDYGKPF